MTLSHHQPNQKRAKMLVVRISADELNQIKEDASSLSITVGAYVRQTMVNAPVPPQSRKQTMERQLLGKLLGQIGRVGNNINQIARAANAGIIVAPKNLEQALRQWYNLETAILTALNQP